MHYPSRFVIGIVILFSIEACKRQVNSTTGNENQFPSIQQAMSNPDSVIEIDITYEKMNQELKDFNGTFLPFKNLKVLKFSGHPLNGELPKEVAQLKNLEVLELRSCNAKIIPPDIGELIQLKTLALNGNNIERFPIEMSKLVNLEKLDVGLNRDTTTIMEMLCHFKKLQYLNIEASLFYTIPPCVMELKELKVLIASYCYLSTLPDNLGNIKQLEELHIHNSDFVNTDAELEKLAGLVNLKKLTMSNISDKQAQRIKELLPNVELNNIGKTNRYRAF